jgi:hypothetical protein
MTTMASTRHPASVARDIDIDAAEFHRDALPISKVIGRADAR